jgi:hypothetical protein
VGAPDRYYDFEASGTLLLNQASYKPNIQAVDSKLWLIRIDDLNAQ